MLLPGLSGPAWLAAFLGFHLLGFSAAFGASVLLFAPVYSRLRGLDTSPREELRKTALAVAAFAASPMVALVGAAAFGHQRAAPACTTRAGTTATTGRGTSG